MKITTWLESAREEDPSVQACQTCEGSGWNDQATGIICDACRGFGY